MNYYYSCFGENNRKALINGYNFVSLAMIELYRGRFKSSYKIKIMVKEIEQIKMNAVLRKTLESTDKLVDNFVRQ